MSSCWVEDSWQLSPNPLARFEGHNKTGEREGKGRKGGKRKEEKGWQKTLP